MCCSARCASSCRLCSLGVCYVPMCVCFWHVVNRALFMLFDFVLVSCMSCWRFSLSLLYASLLVLCVVVLGVVYFSVMLC